MFIVPKKLFAITGSHYQPVDLLKIETDGTVSPYIIDCRNKKIAAIECDELSRSLPPLDWSKVRVIPPGEPIAFGPAVTRETSP